MIDEPSRPKLSSPTVYQMINIHNVIKYIGKTVYVKIDNDYIKGELYCVSYNSRQHCFAYSIDTGDSGQLAYCNNNITTEDTNLYTKMI